jgi:hypothetical protein
VDFARNPHAREFCKYAVLEIRYGKAMKGSPWKRRSVPRVFDSSAEILADWLERGHPHMSDGLDLFPSERGILVSDTALNRRFNRYCEEPGLSPGRVKTLRRAMDSSVRDARKSGAWSKGAVRPNLDCQLDFRQ